MKTKLLASLILVLAGICAWQWRASEETAKRLSETERALQMERQAREAEEAKALGLEQQQSGLKDQIADLSSLVVSLRTAEAKRAANSDRGAQPSANSASAGAEDPKTAPGESFFGKGMSGMVSKMMKDPAMRGCYEIHPESRLRRRKSNFSNNGAFGISSGRSKFS